MKFYPSWHRSKPESHESIRTQEIRRLRQMATSAAAEGDTSEARKLDRMADQLAQRPLNFNSKAGRRPDRASSLGEPWWEK